MNSSKRKRKLILKWQCGASKLSFVHSGSLTQGEWKKKNVIPTEALEIVFSTNNWQDFTETKEWRRYSEKNLKTEGSLVDQRRVILKDSIQCFSFFYFVKESLRSANVIWSIYVNPQRKKLYIWTFSFSKLFHKNFKLLRKRSTCICILSSHKKM